MTDRKDTATEIDDAALETATGGAGYIKIGDIDGESAVTVTSWDMVGKRDIGTGAKTGGEVSFVTSVQYPYK